MKKAPPLVKFPGCAPVEYTSNMAAMAQTMPLHLVYNEGAAYNW